MTALHELQSALSSTAGRVGPSVVGIGARHRGSGVIVADGQVLTNAHNVRGEEVTVTFADGRSTRGRVAGVDMDGDLAVVTVDTSGAAPLPWADEASASIGTFVLAAAAVPGGGTRVTVGTVSAVGRAFRGPGGRRIAGTIEHTAPLAPGSSGGPLVDLEGRLLGIDTNRLGDGFYLAVPADAGLRQRVESLSRGETTQRLRLGVAIAPAHVARRLRRSVGLPEREGILVREVEREGPAAAAGIQEGDLIVEVGGRPVRDADTLLDVLSASSWPLEVRIVRGTDERTVSVAGEAPAKG